VLDRSGWVLDAVRPKLGEAAKRFALVETTLAPDDPAAEDSLNRRVRDEELFAYFIIGPDPVEGSAGSQYLSRNLTDSDLREWFAERVTAAVRVRRLAREQIDSTVAAWIQDPLRFDVRKVTGAGGTEEVTTRDRLRQWAPLVFVYLLWVSVFSISQMLLTNTVEEKSNRIIEVLLSSVSPVELMAGKIVGIAQTGFTIITTWIVAFIAITKYLPGWLGAPASLDLSVLANDPVYLTSFVAYFLLGYLLFAAMLVGIGAVCNTLKEAQNLMGPVTILLIIPLLAMTPIGRDPNGTLAKVMSFIPPFTPFVMMNRAAGPPALWEYVATTALLLVSIAIALWAAAKVFRIGVLLTGKPPKLGQILRWIRAPVGTVVVRREP
jgi:ABC-2 type transport system permease protein